MTTWLLGLALSGTWLLIAAVVLVFMLGRAVAESRRRRRAIRRWYEPYQGNQFDRD